ncbi:MAG TPA: class I SAM-dependent methyltransferase [Thermoanaerobaculia bacterium]|nr:class I SAM-dependent methyltransferase [Thermoanaerobaculia bacterium]
MTDPSDWHADPAFWIDSYPFLFPPESYVEQERVLPQILALAGRERGAVLDLSCGPGRHAVPLARRGFGVTGVDSTPFLLDKARELAGQEGVEVELVLEDMRRFVRPAAFDLALNLTVSFGYFEDPAENLRVLENVYASLRPGGVFVLEVSGKEVTARGYHDTGSWGGPDKGYVVQRRRIIDDWSRMEVEWVFALPGTTRFLTTRHWLYSGQELKALLAGAGFTRVDLYGSFAGAPYGSEAETLIAVAVK